MQTNPFTTTVELVQGEYWRVVRLDGSKKPLPIGQVHMLKSIRDVDGIPHTIVLAGHPSQGDVTYRFLVDEFLRIFEPISQEEAATVRQREVDELQRQLADIQADMSEMQADPLRLTAAIEPLIRKWETTQNVSPGSTDSLKVLDADTDITPSLTVANVEEAKLAIARKAEEAKLVAGWFSDKAATMTKLVNAMVPYFKEKAEAALAKTEDVRRMVTRLNKGIQSLDLYVGTDVLVTTIREGQSAPDTVKLTIKQSKLYVDEELSVWAEVDASFDYRNIKQFCSTLAENESLVNQIFPTERSIVCMATTRQWKDYRRVDPLRAAEQEAWNREVFLLVRDGGNIHHVVSSVESHLKTEHLFPSNDEIQKIFQKDRHTWWGEEEKPKEYIPFEHVEYTDRVEKHDDVALHYRRFLILLGGLDHRLNLFGTFHNEPKSMNFFSERFQAENMVFLRDDEINPLQLTGEKKETFQNFAARHNKLLRSGSRVVCDWRAVITSKTAPSLVRYDRYEDRLRVELQERTGIRVVYREGEKLCVKCPVESGYKGHRYDAAIDLSKYGDHYSLGFLVLDRVKSSDLFNFIHDRIARRSFLGYIRMFKAAALYLQAEEARQQPTVDNLVNALTDAGVAWGPAAEEIVDTAIAAWRSENRGAELPPASDPKFKQILNQLYALAKQETLLADVTKYAAMAIQEIPLRLSLTGKSKIILYTEPPSEEREDRLFRESWVKRYRIEQTKSGLKHEFLAWVPLLESSAIETVIHEYPEAASWVNLFTPLSREEKATWLHVLDSAEVPFWIGDGWSQDQFDQTFDNWKLYRDNIMADKRERRVITPRFSLPICAISREDKPYTEMIRLTRDVSEALYLNAPSDADRERVKKEYLRWYQAKHRDSIWEQFLNVSRKLMYQQGYEKTDMDMEHESCYSQYAVEVGGDLSQPLLECIRDWKKAKRAAVCRIYMPVNIRLGLFPNLNLQEL